MGACGYSECGYTTVVGYGRIGGFSRRENYARSDVLDSVGVACNLSSDSQMSGESRGLLGV